jgi:hypothetical protein
MPKAVIVGKVLCHIDELVEVTTKDDIEFTFAVKNISH